MATTHTTMQPVEPLNDQQVIQIFQQKQEDLTAIIRRIADIEGEKTEHEYVLKTLNALEGSRRCYRMVGGILVERTVAETAPAVREHMDGLTVLSGRLRLEAEKRQTDLAEFKAKWKIRETKQGGAADDEE